MASSSPLFSTLCFHTNLNPKVSPKLNRTYRKTLTAPAIPPLSAAVDVAVDRTTITVIAGGSVVALSAVLSFSDAEKAEEIGGGDKEVVREYFNNNGFERWKKIYGETDDVNRVQLDIRIGHSKTVENVIKILTDEGPLNGVMGCDAGGGTGCLAILLAKKGVIVTAIDISSAMVAETENQAREELLTGKEELSPAPVLPKFEVKDLESLEGKYNTVVCLDVFDTLPPKTLYYDLLKRVGELFPGPSKATWAYLHAEADVERALSKVGWRIRKRGLITTQF
ncbi:magnesium-protoporphyrin IX methyltransferase [Actinidia rufa]|uniref:Magnesium-protoporphyrin IX methyltransferase n=1 Tax=Actinidia rufa TaxID=165716 RepID=A0A7J0FZ18_9ERIC|nr:magnesium-protoporphyrin IX methyltransferase [Actinidia rufa]